MSEHDNFDSIKGFDELNDYQRSALVKLLEPDSTLLGVSKELDIPYSTLWYWVNRHKVFKSVRSKLVNQAFKTAELEAKNTLLNLLRNSKNEQVQLKIAIWLVENASKENKAKLRKLNAEAALVEHQISTINKYANPEEDNGLMDALNQTEDDLWEDLTDEVQ
ncbi:MAG: hypothetical protein LBV67_06240 [Streptococcaceae bacterium]|nr:hypothetical protein [Streptococcaceae bacterium]